MTRDLSHLLVTGGAGFIGSTLVRRLLACSGVEDVHVLDALTYAGKKEHLPDDGRLIFHQADIRDLTGLREIFAAGAFSGVLHLAAESHVDRSIITPADFVTTNITGTANLLEVCREYSVPLLHCSTDEVYGSITVPGEFSEESPICPSSPYSASKAAADLLCLAAHRTYGQDVVITRGSNNYGPRQHPEKLIPRMVHCALRDLPLPVYGDGLQVRDWLHTEDYSDGMILAFLKGRSGEVYNFGAREEMTNLSLIHQLLGLLGKPESLIRHVQDRPGHDRRYAVNPQKAISELGWEPCHRFSESFPQVIHELVAELAP